MLINSICNTGIKIDSFVDEITNSSTVIYTWASKSSKEMVRNFLQDVLIDAGSDKKVDDLYEIKLVPQDVHEIVSNLMNQDDEDEEKIDYDVREQLIRDRVNKMIEEENEFSDGEFENYMGFTPSTTIIVTSKLTGKKIDLSNLFHSDGVRDG